METKKNKFRLLNNVMTCREKYPAEAGEKYKGFKEKK